MKKSLMKGILVVTAVIFAAAAGPVSACAAETKAPTGTAELIEHAKRYDDQEIVFQGEAIGDILYRGSNAWVNVSDADNSAIGVYMSARTAEQISKLGCYGVKGDTLRITGTFHRACPDHGGDMDIHLKSLQIVSRGRSVSPEIPDWLPVLAIGSTLCAAPLGAFAFHRVRCYTENKKSSQES